MELKLGMIVKSMAGHDAGRFYVVVKILENRAYIADGRLRQIEKPKAKNPVHLSKSNKIIDDIYLFLEYQSNLFINIFLYS